MRVLVVGPPGAGKGTQAARLSEQLEVPHIATGDLFRAHVSGATELGEQIRQYLDSGELVPDAITNEMVRERLSDPDCAKGFLLDGYPRTVGQARELDQMLAQRDQELDAVLRLDVPEEVVVERLLARGRGDDTEDVIRRRQQVYREETAPLLDFYADRLVPVDAVGEVEDITARCLAALQDWT